MQITCYILTFISLLLNVTLAKSKCFHKNETLSQYIKPLSTGKDQFYIIIVENPHKNDTSIAKRELNDIYIDGLVGEINSLIVGNKDTYENPEKLDELDSKALQRKKRDNQESYAFDYGDSNYVYKISSTENKTVLYAFLSDTLSKTVDAMPHVISCQPDSLIKYTLDYKKSEVLKETNWKGIEKKVKARSHLSLLSQGKFNDKLVNQYDDTYYYPSSAGKDINIVILDTGFNFGYSEFEKSDRNVQCAYYIKEAKARNTVNKKYCYNENNDVDDNNHGTKVADIAAGKKSGAAPKANVYGVLIDFNDEDYIGKASIISALETIKSKLIKPYKTVLNISHGYLWNENSTTEIIEQSNYILDLLSEISKKAVVVVSAGNSSSHLNYSESEVFRMYCYSKDVICVGGIDNYVNKMKTMETANYKISEDSNFGECVDIYAPYSVRVHYKDQNSKVYAEEEHGTSFSAPIVAGVAATIMSDQNKTNYNTQSMLEYLKKIGIKNAISGLSNDSNNLLINNGKHIVYSKDNVYYGCGVNSGNRKCGKNQCCSKYGYCGTTAEYCEAGCQSNFGHCTYIKK